MGFALLADHSTRPGPQHQVLASITAGNRSANPFGQSGRPTIVLFYHPKCPRTVATIRCLERLSAKFDRQTEIYGFVYRPGSKPDAWTETRSTAALRAMPGARIQIDVDAESCRRFGVVTSGRVLVYDAQGRLSFSGAITPYRGHEGDCRASAQFVLCVNGESQQATHWPVFGCPLYEPSE